MCQSPPNPPAPERFRPEDLECVARFIREVSVDEATVWMVTREGNALEAIHNPVNAGLEGMVQELSVGLISQVYATGLPLLENDVSKRNEHDPRIDSHTGKATTALLAAPIAAGGEIVGVVSAVRLTGSVHRDRLGGSDLTRLQALADTLGRILDESSPDPDQGA